MVLGILQSAKVDLSREGEFWYRVAQGTTEIGAEYVRTEGNSCNLGMQTTGAAPRFVFKVGQTEIGPFLLTV